MISTMLSLVWLNPLMSSLSRATNVRLLSPDPKVKAVAPLPSKLARVGLDVKEE